MIGFKFICAIFITYMGTFSHADDDHGTNALSFDPDTFKAGLAKGRNFVMFFAPWCGHCKNLAPTWDELAKVYNSGEDSPVVVAKVDCTVHTALCSEHDITGFPTLKLFEKGGVTHKRYSGKRDLESLKTFVQEQVTGEGPIGDAPPAEDKAKPEVPEPKSSMVVLDDDNFEAKVANGAFFVKFYAPWCGHCKRLAPTWDDLANTFSSNEKVNIGKIDCTQSSVICKKFGVRGYPTLLWFENGEKMGDYNGDRSHEALKNYVSEKLGVDTPDKVQQNRQEAAAEDDGDDDAEGQVRTLTTDNFDSYLADRLVFVKFFAPWCGHCKRLAPTWDDLAKEFTSEQVAIAKVDCTQHKAVCDKNEVRGYPTLKIFRDGEMLEGYKGPRGLEDLVKFTKKHLEGGHDEL